MRKMNKVTAAVLAAAMIGAMAVPAFAEDTNQPGKGSATVQTTSGSTLVKYSVTEEYEWTIHDVIDFDKDKGISTTVVQTQDTANKAAKVAVSTNKIGDGKHLVIKVAGTSTEGFKVKNGDTELGYTITKTAEEQDGTAITPFTEKVLALNGEVLKLAAGTNTGEASLKFTLTTTSNKAETAGDYKDTLTYTASIE